ncbi:DUF695 domain-containing protein [Pseudomonas xanthosomatis]|uniref:DUF695 domain-containing protein n=1 Tax=Pseudomonas xanthosomatis TaxID=2842356 RepID=UPI0035126F9A
MRVLLISILVFGAAFMESAESTWSVGTSTVQGRRVVYKYIDSVPPASTRQQLPWLTIVSWKYDGDKNDGMPPPKTNQAMIALEDALETLSDHQKACLEVYTGTGNNLKEFAFYIADREAFMVDFNNALSGHPAYPIEINFYEDREWSDLAKLHQRTGVIWK